MTENASTNPFLKTQFISTVCVVLYLMLAALLLMVVFGIPKPSLWFKSKEQLMQRAIDAQTRYETLNDQIEAAQSEKYAELRDVEAKLKTDSTNRDLLRKRFELNAEIRKLHKRWGDECFPLMQEVEELEKRIGGL